jgi:hypothetical protein
MITNKRKSVINEEMKEGLAVPILVTAQVFARGLHTARICGWILSGKRAK